MRACENFVKERGEIANEWVEPYTHMFEVSILAYMVNGLTLGRAYFDFLYQVVALLSL